MYVFEVEINDLTAKLCMERIELLCEKINGVCREHAKNVSCGSMLSSSFAGDMTSLPSASLEGALSTEPTAVRMCAC
jgi:hypothetical protein